MNPEHRAELLRQIKGSPQPEEGIGSLAERMGVSILQARSMVEQLVAEGALQRDGDRLVVIELAASAAPDDRPIP